MRRLFIFALAFFCSCILRATGLLLLAKTYRYFTAIPRFLEERSESGRDACLGQIPRDKVSLSLR